MSFEDFEAKAERHKPKAAILVHIGGHLAFDAERIAAYCRENGIFLLEDCAHAHGADWSGRRPGAFGDAGVYSLYATKTVSTGEGGVLVSSNPELIEFAAQVPQLRQVRARGRRAQLPDERVHRRPRPGPGRAHGGDRRLEERVRPRAPRPVAPGAAGAARRDDLGPLQVHRLRTDREEHGPRLRPALPPDHGPLRRSAQHRLGGREPLVRAALLPSGEPRGGSGQGGVRHEGPGNRRRRLHRLARRRSPDRTRRHAADLRPQRLPLPLPPGSRDLHRQHHRPGQPRPGDARLRRGHPPRRGRRRRPRARRPGAGRGGQHARHAERAGGRLPGQGRPRRLRLDHLGLQRLRRAGRRRGDADPGAAPPLHRDQARRRDLLRRLRRAVRPRVHGAALRHPLRAARPRRRRRRQVHRPGARRQGADDRRRRQPVPQLHLRRGPGRRDRRRHEAGGGQPHLQPLRRRGGDDPRDRRDGAGDDRRLRDRPHAAAPRRLPRQGDLQRPRPGGAGLEGGDELPRGRAPVRRVGARQHPGARPDPRQKALAQRQRTRRRRAALRRLAIRGAPAADPRPHRRHRRGARPPRPDHQGRRREGDPRRRDRGRQRARGDGADRLRGRPRRLEA